MKRIKIYLNKEMTIMGPLVVLISFTAFAYIYYGFNFGPVAHESMRLDLFENFILIAIGCFGSFGWFMFWPQWFSAIVLEKDSITIKVGKKKITESYDMYPCVYLADYYHNGFRPCFIVFAKTGLFEDELTHINRIPVDENVIKIRYSKKTYAKLMEILPEYHREMVQDVVENADRKVY